MRHPLLAQDLEQRVELHHLAQMADRGLGDRELGRGLGESGRRDGQQQGQGKARQGHDGAFRKAVPPQR